MQISAPEADTLTAAIQAAIPGQADAEAILAALLPTLGTIVEAHVQAHVQEAVVADRRNVLGEIGRMRTHLNDQFDAMEKARRSEIDAMLDAAMAPARPGR